MLLLPRSWHAPSLFPNVTSPLRHLLSATSNINHNLNFSISPFHLTKMATSNEESPTSKSKGKSTPPTIDDQQTLADRRKSDRARMPPPASTIMFAPPPSPTYTTRQVLAYQVQMPSPTSVPRRGSVTINHPVQSSIAPEFRWIVGSSLQRIRKLHISEFRSRIEMMDCVKFDDPMALPWHASPMLSEGCVTSYLDAQVLGAAWQVVLQMVPQERDYDLQMVKQATITVCHPHSPRFYEANHSPNAERNPCSDILRRKRRKVRGHCHSRAAGPGCRQGDAYNDR